MSDLESLVTYADNIKIASNLTNKFPHPYTRESGESFINFAMTGPALIQAIDINGAACGGIGIHPQDDVYEKNAELGYWLAEPYWGKGIITKAIKLITPMGFDKFDITRIFARPYGSNIASQKALEKADYKLEAKLHQTFYKSGRFEDELIYAVRKQ